MKRIRFIAALGIVAALSAMAQLNTLVQTSLSSSITATQTQFNIASGTGIVVPSNGVAGSSIWVQDPGQPMGEFMPVIAIVPPGTTGTTLLTVSRARGNAKPHLSGSMVLIASAPNWFQTTDPMGSCTVATTYVTPWLNITNGRQWICSAKTLAWIPGWGNTSAPAQINAASAVASVAGVTGVDGPLIHVSGTNAITSWQPGIGWRGQGFCVIPDGAFTTTTTGPTATAVRITPISLGSTAVANKTLCFSYDFTANKFSPSY